ncbi:MAG: YetF domain-containing protein [Sporichthyaceae bacterium]
MLISEGRVRPEALHRARLRESDLHVALRRAGVGGYADVAAAVLERSGSISVVRRNPASTEALADLTPSSA